MRELRVGLRGGPDHASQTATQQLQFGADWAWVAPHRHGVGGSADTVIALSALFCTLGSGKAASISTIRFGLCAQAAAFGSRRATRDQRDRN
jgi:hypothetical protein